VMSFMTPEEIEMAESMSYRKAKDDSIKPLEIGRAQWGDIEARDNILQKSNGLCLKWAVRLFKNHNPDHTVEIEDLMQAGVLGVLEAIENYDGEIRIYFHFYRHIRAGMKKCINCRAITIPMAINDAIVDIDTARHAIYCETGHYPTAEELSDEFGIELEAVDDVLQLSGRGDVVSLDNGLSLHETVSTPQPNATIVAEILPTIGARDMSEDEWELFSYYFGLDGRLPRTLKVLGTQHGVTAESMRQKRNLILRRELCNPRKLGRADNFDLLKCHLRGVEFVVQILKTCDGPMTVDEVFDATSWFFNISRKRIAIGGRSRAMLTARHTVATLLKRRTSLPKKKIAAILDCDVISLNESLNAFNLWLQRWHPKVGSVLGE